MTTGKTTKLPSEKSHAWNNPIASPEPGWFRKLYSLTNSSEKYTCALQFVSICFSKMIEVAIIEKAAEIERQMELEIERLRQQEAARVEAERLRAEAEARRQQEEEEARNKAAAEEAERVRLAELARIEEEKRRKDEEAAAIAAELAEKQRLKERIEATEMVAILGAEEPAVEPLKTAASSELSSEEQQDQFHQNSDSPLDEPGRLASFEQQMLGMSSENDTDIEREKTGASAADSGQDYVVTRTTDGAHVSSI